MRKQQLGGAIITSNISIICMMMIDPATGWFKNFEIPTYYLDKVMGGNDDNIY